jgi:hypothetical protein
MRHHQPATDRYRPDAQAEHASRLNF